MLLRFGCKTILRNSIKMSSDLSANPCYFNLNFSYVFFQCFCQIYFLTGTHCLSNVRFHSCVNVVCVCSAVILDYSLP